MASACAVTMAGIPTPATSAVPAALLSSVRRDNLEFMTTPPIETQAACSTTGKYAARPAVAAAFSVNDGPPVRSACPADFDGEGGGNPRYQRIGPSPE